MGILSIYLADREQVVKSFLKYCPNKPVLMKSPTLITWITFGLILFFCGLDLLSIDTLMEPVRQ
ncbi:MAG: hypothetical protein R3C24_04490 [Cyanobacteriota/Melainabacteria group bacterium]